MVIRAVDTDVLVLAVSVYEELKDGIEKLWVDFCERTGNLSPFTKPFNA